MTKTAGAGSASGSGSTPKWHGSGTLVIMKGQQYWQQGTVHVTPAPRNIVDLTPAHNCRCTVQFYHAFWLPGTCCIRSAQATKLYWYLRNKPPGFIVPETPVSWVFSTVHRTPVNCLSCFVYLHLGRISLAVQNCTYDTVLPRTPDFFLLAPCTYFYQGIPATSPRYSTQDTSILAVQRTVSRTQ